MAFWFKKSTLNELVFSTIFSRKFCHLICFLYDYLKQLNSHRSMKADHLKTGPDFLMLLSKIIDFIAQYFCFKELPAELFRLN